MQKRKSLIARVKGLFSREAEIPLPEQETSLNLDEITIEQFQQILKYGKSSNRIAGYESLDFVQLPYGLIKRELPILQKQGKFAEMVDLVVRHQFPDADIRKATGNELMSFLLWIKEQQERINTIELNYLASDPDPKMVAAGIHQLNEMGEIPTIDQLAKGDILKYAEIEALPYYRVYEKLKLEKIMNDINKRYEEIIKNQTR